MFPSLCRMLGGILLFFAGIASLRKGLRKRTGTRVEQALKRVAPKPITAVITGVLVTCTLQSSSAVTVIVVGLVDAGVIDIYQAFYIIIGANLGTCLTAYIVAFHVRILGPLTLIIGASLYVFIKQRRGRDPGLVFLGLGCILEGVRVTASALVWIAEIPDVLNILVVFGQVPFFGVLAGTALTGIIQSSSVITALLVGLVREGLINLKSAVSMALGSNIGTCMTTLVAGLGASPAGRFTALLHLMFNIAGVAAILPVFSGFVKIIEAVSPADPGYRLANAHTLFNLFSILVVFPWGRQFVDLVKGRQEWM